MTIGIIGILSLIFGIIGCLSAHWYIGAVFCLISVILGIVGLTDYLSYKWTSIVGIIFAVIGFGIFSWTIYSDMESGKLVILYFEDDIEQTMYDQGEEADGATKSIAETETSIPFPEMDSEVVENEPELEDLLPEEIVNDLEGTEEVGALKKSDLLDGNYSELGEGTAYISTAGGTSENGNIPVLYANEDSLVQIGLNAWDFNGGALSFIYVDGNLLTKEQLANTQTSLNLSGSNLTVGVHRVEVVQYENDDPTGAMITYKFAEYEVKPE